MKECVECGKSAELKQCACCSGYYCTNAEFTCCDICDERVCKKCTVYLPEDPPICDGCHERQIDRYMERRGYCL